MGPQELQAAVMAYADTTNTLMGEAAAIINAIGTPQARLTAARMLVFNLSSNTEIASGPYPGVSLLDMTVVATLRRMVWEDFWIPQIFGEEGKPALAIIKEAEKDIWEVAERIMTPAQREELKRVIMAWRTNTRTKSASTTSALRTLASSVSSPPCVNSSHQGPFCQCRRSRTGSSRHETSY